jgi:predicted MPP superfamily phosphohydrolase
MRFFGTALLAAWTLLHLYVFGRAWTVPAIRRRVPRAAFLGGATALWATFALSRFAGHDAGGRFADWLELFCLSAMAALFLCAVALFAVDLATGFGLLLRRRAPALRGWALVAGGLLAATALVQGLRPPVVSRHEVRLRGLPAALDGTVIVALSDLHLGSLLDGSWLAARAAQIAAEQPDMVVLLGDLVEGHGAAEGDLLRALARVRAPLGVWAVAGNHERFGTRGGAGLLALEEAGARVLHDRWAEAAPGLVVAGVDDLTSRRRAGTGGDAVGASLAGRPPGATVLLSHTPWDSEKAARAGVGLMLSGHTHGGQIWPFGYLVRLAYPLLAGRYEVGGMTVLVSRGAGTWGPRMRLWRPGEILRVTLRATEPERR